MRNLPHSTSDRNKVVKELIRVHSKELEMIDYYSNYHTPYKWTAFEENIAFQIGHLARNFMPTYRTNFSPFDPSRREVRGSLKNPSLTGQSSTSSTTSSTSSSLDEYSSDSDDEQVISNRNTSSTNDREETSFATLLSSTMDVYGFEIKQPQSDDALKYKRYVQMGRLSMPSRTHQFAGGANARNILPKAVTLAPLGNYGTDSYQNVHPPNVSPTSMSIYEKYIMSAQTIYSKNNEPDNELLNYFQFNYYASKKTK